MIFKFNKGAMFGLSLALRKQHGVLFLARRQSEDSQETSGSFKTNRGAMFGLDARIALAIFGALSVISGAALYSAIKDAKTTATLAKLNELGKAYESYLLDTGEMLPVITATPVVLNVQELLVSANTKWKGPYIAFKDMGIENQISNEGKEYFILYRPGTAWGMSLTAAANIGGPAACATAPCYIWVSAKLDSLQEAKDLDLKVDGVQNGQEGNLRVLDGGAPKYNVYYKYAVAPVQP